MKAAHAVFLGWLASTVGGYGCSECPLSARMAPTVTQEALLALRVGMPEVTVHELLGRPIAGNRTSTPRRPHRWYYAVPACFGRTGWTVEVQILDEKLFGVSAAEGEREAFRCFSGDCRPIVDGDIFAHLPVGMRRPSITAADEAWFECSVAADLRVLYRHLSIAV
jgi:hypothetical protein